MKISVIATVLNEKTNIKRVLNSIFKQTKEPDEIVIVDGGSKDQTYKILREYAKRHRSLKVFQKKGANIPEGRNVAIKKTKNNVIVVVDAGTIYEKNWLKNLVQGFKGDVGFGKTIPLGRDNFQRKLAKIMGQRFGSIRNMVFKKEVWKEVGGCPEDLYMADDTVFNERIKKAGFKINYVPNAISYWEMRKNLKELKKQFYNYGYWDGVAYRRYRILPLKSKVLIIGITVLSPLYPLLWIISRASLFIKIYFTRFFAYVNGFWKGFFNVKDWKI